MRLLTARIVASALLRLMGRVNGVIVCDDGSVDLTGDVAEFSRSFR